MFEISKGVLKQTILAICASQAYFCCGLERGFTSPALPSMDELDPGLIPDINILSWISSVAPLAAFFGSMFAAPIMNAFGRKKTIIFASPPWVVSWIIIATATRWEIVLLGRIISGVCDGLSIPCAQIYVTECVSPKIRGVLGTIPAVSITSGVLVSFIAGAFVSWRVLSWINCALCVILFIVVLFMPESPLWLKTKKRIEEAEIAAQWLHLEEFESTIVDNFDEEKVREKLYCKDVLLSRRVCQPLLICMILLGIQQLSGIDTIVFYTVEIFRSAGSSLDSHICTIIIGTLLVSGIVLSLFIIDSYGRRPLLIVSGIIITVATFMMGVAFFIFEQLNNKEWGLLPIASLILYIAGFSFGFGSVPFLIMGELLPTEHRGALSSITGSSTLLIMFIVVQTYHPTELLISKAGAFWMYSGFCLIGVIFVIFCLPETKGKSFENIEKLFARKPDTDVEKK